MAYDPNDPADKKIVSDAVAAALAEQAEDHEAEVERLKAENAKARQKLRDARSAGGDGNAEEITRLETELAEVSGRLRTAETDLRTTKRNLTTAEQERDTARTGLETESTFARNMIVENGLTAALVEANVAPQFMDAAKAMLAKDVTVKVDGDTRMAVVGDKSVKDHVAAWSQGDQGKHFVTAPANAGSNTGDTNPAPQGGAKKISEMTEGERVAHYNKVGQAEFDRQVAAERTVK